jgi:N-acetylneuraminic acid mutarotase
VHFTFIAFMVTVGTPLGTLPVIFGIKLLELKDSSVAPMMRRKGSQVRPGFVLVFPGVPFAWGAPASLPGLIEGVYTGPMTLRTILITAGFIAGQGTVARAAEDSWEPVANMPTARESVAACAVDGQVFAIGGFPGGSDSGLPTNERYDLQTDTWSRRAPMPSGRRMPAAVEIDGKCYLLGGRRTDGPRGLDTVEVYDPAADRWESRTPMPNARFGHSAVAVGPLIYVFGGGENGAATAQVDIYDSRSDSWSSAGNMPAPRVLMGAALLDGRIYLVGGTFDGNSGVSRVDVFDPDSESWSSAELLPTRRFSLSAAVANGRLYAIGGTDGPGALRTVEAYDPRSDTWSSASPMITWRARFATAVAAGQVYAVGGTTSFAVPHVGMDEVERYTPLSAGGVTINAGMNDAWYNSATAGQGFLVTVFPDIGQLFLAWFTYDAERPPESATAVLGEPGHRWLTAQGPYQGDRAELTVFVTRGGVFDSTEPVAETDPPGGVGTMTIEFADCSEGLITYELPAAGLSGEIPIERIVDDRVALCQQLDGL